MQKNTRLEKDVRGLLFLNKFGWLRTVELGKLVWPNSPAFKQLGVRLADGWIKKKLVIVRDLPGRAGRIFVLARGGVELLARHGIEASSGKNIGRIEADGWRPPATWQHDLIAHGVLCELHKKGYEIYPENEIKKSPLRAGVKVPDGLAVKENRVIWVEVENARKSGKYAKELAKALIYASQRSHEEVFKLKATDALVAFPDDVVSEKGYSIDHESRVKKMISSITDRTVNIHFAKCEMLGLGVASVSMKIESIDSDRAIAIMKQLEILWDKKDNEIVINNYNGFKLSLQRQIDAWQVEIFQNNKQVHRESTKTISEAKYAAAKFVTQAT